ncbi:MAG: hypothetical protein UT28_C0001G0308 [Berkelbacteria bacterium GW2011_GWE1_39_12]|uniref:Uncharacterized protein n=1 Tax=Berkelbacteria bacterium GW2011_GWE1_39_12 TaxID=1618337 RepID=A0A0G4B545_9BACT|nr:MAG: hypothetical protein UT28_C0001G0308 [Berkelbacteria bacterium GW2011_GWE1_39_12]
MRTKNILECEHINVRLFNQKTGQWFKSNYGPT